MRTSFSRSILFLCAAINLALGLAGFAQESVSITLGLTNTEQGLLLKEPDGGATTVVTNGGSSARSTQPPQGTTGGFMYFATDPAFANAGSVATLFVTVEYWDEGTDQFRIEYDAQPDPANPNPDTDPFTPAQAGASLAKYDTKKWVTYQFRLANVFFGKRQPGASDFRINDLTVDAQGNPVDGEAPEVIRKVVVSKTEPIPLHIKFATVPPKIDGTLDDQAWKEAQVFKVDSALQDVIRPSAWQGTNDYSLDARFAWDNTYLYLAYDVTDDVPRANTDVPATAWNGDGAEVYFGFDQSNPGRSTYLPDTDFHLALSAGPNPTWAVYFLNGTFEPVAGGPFQPADNMIVKDRPNGYIMEARIPWAMLVGANGTTNAPPVPGQLVGFNVFGNDGDNPDAPAQEVAMGFSGRPRAYLDPGAWSTVQMDPPASQPTNSPVTVQDPGNVVGTGTNAWSYLILEGEDYASELDPADGVGFTRVDNSG
ncbi:MAG: sugar-binding protein, partial [Verrucomicrobiota bacterium]